MQEQPPEAFYAKKVFLEISQNWSAACNFIRKETLAQVFSCEFCEIPRIPFSLNTSGRLLLKVVCINRAGQLQIFKTYLGLNHLSVSYALGHNDARGWGYRFVIKIDYRISKFMINFYIFPLHRRSSSEVFLRKAVLKIAANLQKNIHAEVQFQ